MGIFRNDDDDADRPDQGGAGTDPEGSDSGMPLYGPALDARARSALGIALCWHCDHRKSKDLSCA